MPRRSKTVAGPHVHGIMRIVECAGMGPAEFAGETGVTAEEVRDPRSRVGWARYERVLEVLQRVRQRPAPGPSSMVWFEEHFPVLAAACYNARTAREAVRTFLGYRQLLDEFNWVEVREQGGAMQVEYVAEGPQRYAALQSAGNFDLLAHLVRGHASERDTSFSAGLKGAAEPLARRLASMLGGRVDADAGRNVLTFPTAGLDEPLPHHNPALRRILERELDQQLAELARDASLAVTVEGALRRSVGGRRGLDAHAVLEEVCAELRVTRWTLRRRLAEEGHSFKELHARVRVQQARQLLEQSSLSLGEVSDRLGFTTPSSFTRFFRNEVGMPPHRYRRQAEEDGGLTTRRG